jgi:hypothetical protein
MATTHTPTSQLIADHMRSAPTFPATPAPQHQSAWHQQGGISHRTLIHFPTALLRPALSSAAVPGSAAGVPLVCVGNKAFVAGQQDRRRQRRQHLQMEGQVLSASSLATEARGFVAPRVEY